MAGIGKVLQEVAIEYGLAEVLEDFVAKYAGASASEKLPPVFGPRIVEDAASRLLAASGLGADTLFVADGQPVALRLLHHLAAAAALDAAAQLTCELVDGVNLGVDQELQVPPGVMCEKGGDSDADSESEFPSLCAAQHSVSAKVYEAELIKDYMEDVGEGLALGPMGTEEAAAKCRCDIKELCFGSTGIIAGGDKYRRIHSGKENGVNARIKANMWHRHQCPALADARHALAVERRLNPNVSIVALKADFKKAHKRVKVAPSDWKFQVASAAGEVFVNECGVYGIASAQFWWGRLVGLICRLALQADLARWLFLFVDDLWALFQSNQVKQQAPALLLFLMVLGLPFSWRKLDFGAQMTCGSDS